MTRETPPTLLSLVFLVGQWFGIGPITGAVDAVLEGPYGLYRAIEGGLVVQTIEAGAEEPLTQGVYTATPGEWLAAMSPWLGVPLVAVVLGAYRRGGEGHDGRPSARTCRPGGSHRPLPPRPRSGRGDRARLRV